MSMIPPASEGPSSDVPRPDGSTTDSPHDKSRGGQWITAHPVTAFVILAIGLTWLAQLGSIAVLGSIVPGLLAELPILPGVAIFVTGVAEGRPGLRRLFAGVLRWRVGVGWWAMALLALPVLTLLIALVTGTYHAPDGGWLPLLTGYLVSAIVIGAILGNVWEELAWT